MIMLRNHFLNILWIGLMGCLAACNSGDSNAGNAPAEGATDSTKIIAAAYASQLEQVAAGEPIEQLLAQGWVLENDLEVLDLSSEPTGDMPFRSFYFSKDGTFIRDPRNELKYGNWNFDAAARSIRLTYSGGKTEQLRVLKVAAGEMVLAGADGEESRKYVSNKMRYIKTADDPYHISNNQWRVKPIQKETPDQIKNRVRQFLNFHILFYRNNLALESKKISFYGFPTCLKWYAGGIFIFKDKEIPMNWYGCFYDEAQAREAYQLVDQLISKKYNWSKGKISWVLKNLLVLEQMYQKI